MTYHVNVDYAETQLIQVLVIDPFKLLIELIDTDLGAST